MRGEPLDQLSHELEVEAHRLAASRDEFLEHGRQGLKSSRADRGDRAERRLKQAERKVGELTLENEILRTAAEKIPRCQAAAGCATWSWLRIRHTWGDGVVPCRSQAHAEQALALVKDTLADMGLALHEDMTKIVDIQEGQEGFDILGCHFSRGYVGSVLGAVRDPPTLLAPLALAAFDEARTCHDQSER